MIGKEREWLRVHLWKPDYFYIRRNRTLASTDGWVGFDQGFGFFVIAVRWKAKARHALAA